MEGQVMALYLDMLWRRQRELGLEPSPPPSHQMMESRLWETRYYDDGVIGIYDPKRGIEYIVKASSDDINIVTSNGKRRPTILEMARLFLSPEFRKVRKEIRRRRRA